jgi:hypothetical protein
MAVLIVASGRDVITNRLKGSGSEPLYAHWGTGAGTAADGDTTLFTPVQTRVAGTSSRVSTVTPNDTYRVVATLTADAARAISNAGLFDGAGTGTPATGANLFLKGDHGVFNLSSGDSVLYTFEARFS